MNIDGLEVFFGEVIFFSAQKGYGFLKWQKSGEDQKDIFVHFSDIVSNGFKTLHKGDRVKFSVGENKHGVAKAVNVTVVK